MAEKKIHEGRNVKRFREMLGIKQDALAWELGEDWNQKKVSLMEAKETIEPHLLDKVSSILKVPVDAIRNLDEQEMINIITNTFTDNEIGNAFQYYPTFNPLDKLMESFEEVKRLNAELIRAKDEQIQVKQAYIQRLEKMLDTR
ncbi:MAG: XRE family transcriptional regulator [Flavobacteriales bacterium]